MNSGQQNRILLPDFVLIFIDITPHYATVYNMKTTTLAQYFKGLRTERQMSMENVAKASNMHRGAIWKIEHGHDVTVHTLRTLATVGLKIKTGSQEYATLVSLWAAHKGLIDYPTDTINKHIHEVASQDSQQNSHLMLGLIRSAAHLNPEDIDVLAQTLIKDPELILTIARVVAAR